MMYKYDTFTWLNLRFAAFDGLFLFAKSHLNIMICDKILVSGDVE